MSEVLNLSIGDLGHSLYCLTSGNYQMNLDVDDLFTNSILNHWLLKKS